MYIKQESNLWILSIVCLGLFLMGLRYTPSFFFYFDHSFGILGLGIKALPCIAFLSFASLTFTIFSVWGTQAEGITGSGSFIIFYKI